MRIIENLILAIVGTAIVALLWIFLFPIIIITSFVGIMKDGVGFRILRG